MRKAYNKVNWKFLLEIVLRKGLSAGIVHSLVHLFSGGKQILTSTVILARIFKMHGGVFELFFFTACHCSELFLYLFCFTDISSTSFYKPIPVMEFARDRLNLRTVDANRPPSDRDRLKVLHLSTKNVSYTMLIATS
jgi:hypothetical protein